MESENEDIRYEYDQLRRKVAKVLKRIHRFTIAPEPELKSRFDRLMELKGTVDESDVLVDGRLDLLIRDGLITSEMATSLANDSDDVAGISKNLIRIAELLYIQRDPLLSGEAEPGLSEADAEVTPPRL